MSLRKYSEQWQGTGYQLSLKIGISALLFICTTCVFFPGSYSVDSWSQYSQMVAGRYTDWFGPGLAASWQILWLVTSKFSSLFVAQMLLYWLFVCLFTISLGLRSFLYWALIIVSTFFCIIPQYIMRDAEMAIYWGLAAALLLMHPSKIHQVTGIRLAVYIILLFFGLWVRANAVIALIPIVYGVLLAAGKSYLATWKRVGLSIGITILFFVCTNLVTYNVFRADKAYPDYKLKLLDIVGISRLSGCNYLPDFINNHPGFNYDTLMAKYSPASIDHIYWPNDGRPGMLPQPDEDKNKKVTRSWLNAIRAHPILYIRNRGSGFLYYLHVRKRFAKADYWNPSIWTDPNNPLHLQQTHGEILDRLSTFYGFFSATDFYDPWFWLLLNGVCLVYFIYRNKKVRSVFWQVNICIALSGVLYMLSQFLVYQHDRDFRYTYWNVFVVMINLSSLSHRSDRRTIF